MRRDDRDDSPGNQQLALAHLRLVVHDCTRLRGCTGRLPGGLCNRLRLFTLALDPSVPDSLFHHTIQIAGVILNQLGGSRHESKLHKVIEHYTDVQVVGSVYRNAELSMVLESNKPMRRIIEGTIGSPIYKRYGKLQPCFLLQSSYS